MKRFLPKLNLVKLFTRLLVFGSVTILAATAYFVFTIDVLTSWRIMLPNQTKQGDTSTVAPIHAGDQVVIQSFYTKLRNVKGEATRYIECETTKDVFVSYPINVVAADRPEGKEQTGIGAAIVVPRTIPDLPKTCRIRIAIVYPVLPFRSVSESQTSDEFLLLPERATAKDETEQLSPSQTKSSQVQPLSQSSSINNTTNNSQSLSNTSQETEDKPEPNVVDKILNSITKLLGGS